MFSRRCLEGAPKKEYMASEIPQVPSFCIPSLRAWLGWNLDLGLLLYRPEGRHTPTFPLGLSAPFSFGGRPSPFCYWAHDATTHLFIRMLLLTLELQLTSVCLNCRHSAPLAGQRETSHRPRPIERLDSHVVSRDRVARGEGGCIEFDRPFKMPPGKSSTAWFRRQAAVVHCAALYGCRTQKGASDDGPAVYCRR